jgi:DNA-binding MarR family transcriptional regulator
MRAAAVDAMEKAIDDVEVARQVIEIIETKAAEQAADAELDEDATLDAAIAINGRDSDLATSDENPISSFRVRRRMMNVTSLSDRLHLQALLAALQPFGDRHGPMPLAWITTLLLVALDEGKGVAHYAREANLHRAHMSRNLHCLGDKSRQNAGLGLLEVKIDPIRADRRQVFLTEEGRAVVAAIIATLDIS